MTDSRPTLDQRRAQHAWQAVEQARGLKGGDSQNFAQEAKRLPVRIKTAGLGQALAFLGAKAGKDDHRSRLLTELSNWLLDERNLATPRKDTEPHQRLILAIIDGDANLLRRATEEALLYLQWLTRFSEAESIVTRTIPHDES